jgi:hypothetical protein
MAHKKRKNNVFKRLMLLLLELGAWKFKKPECRKLIFYIKRDFFTAVVFLTFGRSAGSGQWFILYYCSGSKKKRKFKLFLL